MAGAKYYADRSRDWGPKSTISSDTGLYDVSGLNAANYNLKVTIKGFEGYEQTGIVVDISRTFRVDVKLTVGSESPDHQCRSRCVDGAVRFERRQHPH